MFSSYFKLGLEHILDPKGLDHVLFIVVLTVPFLLKDWKKVIILATAFTIGHSLTLALSSLDIISVNSRIIEICIAVTILFTAVFNIVLKSYHRLSERYLSALIFGLIHGMGFSNFFKAILGNNEILLPLLAFNLGVELAQLIIVVMVLLLGHLIVKYLKLKLSLWKNAISFIVIIWATKLILERL